MTILKRKIPELSLRETLTVPAIIGILQLLAPPNLMQLISRAKSIDAQTQLKAIVSRKGQLTLDINVIQSDFSGERIENDAPPGLRSREFSSIIRMLNQDSAMLGGLEEKVKNYSGNGVPFLARIPVIK